MSKFQKEFSVYVGNLDHSVPLADMEELIYELFLQAGPIEKIYFPCNQSLHKSYGFVEYEHKESVSYAIFLLSGIRISGRPLKVRTATKSEPITGTELVQEDRAILPVSTPPPVFLSDSETRHRKLFGNRLSPPPFFTSKETQSCLNDKPPALFTPISAKCKTPLSPSIPPPSHLPLCSPKIFREPPLPNRMHQRHPPNVMPPYKHNLLPPPLTTPLLLKLAAQNNHTATAQWHTNGNVDSPPPVRSPNHQPHNSTDVYPSYCSTIDTLPFVPKHGQHISDSSLSSPDHSHQWPHRNRGAVHVHNKASDSSLSSPDHSHRRNRGAVHVHNKASDSSLSSPGHSHRRNRGAVHVHNKASDSSLSSPDHSHQWPHRNRGAVHVHNKASDSSLSSPDHSHQWPHRNRGAVHVHNKASRVANNSKEPPLQGSHLDELQVVLTKLKEQFDRQ